MYVRALTEIRVSKSILIERVIPSLAVRVALFLSSNGTVRSAQLRCNLRFLSLFVQLPHVLARSIPCSMHCSFISKKVRLPFTYGAVVDAAPASIVLFSSGFFGGYHGRHLAASCTMVAAGSAVAVAVADWPIQSNKLPDAILRSSLWHPS